MTPLVLLILALGGAEDDRFTKGGPFVAIQVYHSGKAARAWGNSLGDGLVLTSRRAVGGAGKFEVEGHPASLVRADRGRDLALLKVELGEHRAGRLADRPPAGGDRVHLPGEWHHGDGVGTVAHRGAQPGPPVRVLEFQPRNVQEVARGVAVLDAAGNLAGIVAGEQPAASGIYMSNNARFLCVSEIRAFLEGNHGPARR